MAQYEGKDRYQFQPWYVKGYRLARYRPRGLASFAWRLVWWLLCGAPTMLGMRSRRKVIGLLWSATVGMSDVRAGHYYTMEEVFPPQPQEQP